MDYLKITVNCLSEKKEIILAFLAQLPFDTFEEEEKAILAYIPEAQFGEDQNQELVRLASQIGFTWTKTAIPAQNWNKVWEAGFQAIQVNQFCAIRANFHPPMPEVAHDLIINPKMAFGTGHHETTHLVIEEMEKSDFLGKTVLDYGCGTGVLAILAARCGAQSIDAIDYDVLSYENTLENLETNEVTNVDCYHGTLERLNTKNYDVILANINRNVILDSLEALYAMLNPGGKLLISGFLQEDEEKMKKATQKAGFEVKEVNNRNNWLCISLSR